MSAGKRELGYVSEYAHVIVGNLGLSYVRSNPKMGRRRGLPTSLWSQIYGPFSILVFSLRLLTRSLNSKLRPWSTWACGLHFNQLP